MTAYSFSNQLSKSEEERLVVLMEECSKVIKAASKVLRHGYESTNPLSSESLTNREDLGIEIGDMMAMLGRMIAEEDLDGDAIDTHAADKAENGLEYLHYQSEEDINSLIDFKAVPSEALMNFEKKMDTILKDYGDEIHDDLGFEVAPELNPLRLGVIPKLQQIPPLTRYNPGLTD